MYMLLWNRTQAAQQASCQSHNPSYHPRELILDPRAEHQYVDLTTHTEERISSHVIFLSSESFPQGTGPNLISCFPFYPILCGSFSQPWLYRNLYANFYLAVSDACSMCRCDVFLICLLRKVSSTSSYSAIMISSTGFIYMNVYT